MPFEFTAEVIAVVGVAAMAGWVITTWPRVLRGYPLDGFWDQGAYPKIDELVERMKLLTKGSAELRAEIGSMKDRLATGERIVTDRGSQLTRLVDQLCDKRESVQ